jgi:drug/metabolite transporter (DMT)-like permease
MKARDWCLLLLLSVLWGGAFFFYKVLDDAGLPPLTIVLGRVGIAAVALLAVVRLRGLQLPLRVTDWMPFVFLAIANNVIPFLLISWGETQITSGLASVLNATTPIFTALVAHVATKDERFSVNSIVGIGLGFLGILVLVGPEAVRGLSLYNVAQIGCLCATISYAFAAVYGRRLRKTAPIVVSTCQLVVSTIIVLPFELIVDKPWTLPMLSTGTWAAMLGMALLATSAAYIIYFALINYAGAVNASLVTLLIPVVALILGGLFLHERLGWGTGAGMALILVGLIALDGRLMKAVRRSRSLESINAS